MDKQFLFEVAVLVAGIFVCSRDILTEKGKSFQALSAVLSTWTATTFR